MEVSFEVLITIVLSFLQFRKAFFPIVLTPAPIVILVRFLHPENAPATEIVRILKDEYRIWVCPNGGEIADQVFRIGHIGHITKEDNQALIDALHDMNGKGLL